MVMIVNSGRWCLGFLGNDGFPDQLKLWLCIHSDEELRVHMLTQWLISHHVRGVAWRSPQGSWIDWRAGLFVRQFNRQMQCAGNPILRMISNTLRIYPNSRVFQKSVVILYSS